jgi:hypothetical protein
MADFKYVKPEKLWLKEHPILNEKWVQDRIAEDPSVYSLYCAMRAVPYHPGCRPTG